MGIIAFIFFYIRRQRKAKQNSENDIHESMNVDWDKIEDHYKEVPITTSNSPQLTETTEVTGNTMISTSGVRHYSPKLVQENLENDTHVSHQLKTSPDVVIGMVKPSTNMLGDYTIVKPDGN